jgi:integrase
MKSYLWLMGYLVKDALGRSPYWQAVYSSNGRKIRKSTKCTNKQQARAVLHGFEAAEMLAATASVTEQQIRQVMSETIARVTGRRFYDPTISEHLTAWLKSEKETVSESTIRRYTQVARDFESSLGVTRHARLDALSKDVFLSFRDKLRADGCSPRSVNQTLKILRRPFKLAFDEGLIRHNPIAAIKRLRGSPAEKGIFTREQVGELLAHAPNAEWKLLIALGYYTGARLMDLSKLTWAAIDRKAHTIAFRQKKTGDALLIPIHPALQHYLDKAPAGVGRAPLLPSLAHKSGTGKSGLSMVFKRIMNAAGIEAGVARMRAGKRGRSVSRLSFHSLRHSFTSELARAGVAPEIRQQLTGHRDDSSHRVYTHLELDALRRAVTALPALR